MMLILIEKNVLLQELVLQIAERKHEVLKAYLQQEKMLERYREAPPFIFGFCKFY
jgi:hypothetical protein